MSIIRDVPDGVYDNTATGRRECFVRHYCIWWLDISLFPGLLKANPLMPKWGQYPDIPSKKADE